MTHFRKRLDDTIINQVNEWVVEAQGRETEETQSEQDNDDDDLHGGTGTNATPDTQEAYRPETSSHQGKRLIDVTCAPADIAYPTDLGGNGE